MTTGSAFAALDPVTFEHLVARLLQKLGFKTEVTARTGDGGIDIIAHSCAPITGGVFVVQCKRHLSPIGEPVVRDLYGAVHHVNASKGILVVTSTFTSQARAFAEGKPIELIDGDKLQDLLRSNGIVFPDAASSDPFLIVHIPYGFRVFANELKVYRESIESTVESSKGLSPYACVSRARLQGMLERAYRAVPSAIENITKGMNILNEYLPGGPRADETASPPSVRIVKRAVGALLDRYRELYETTSSATDLHASRDRCLALLAATLNSAGRFIRQCEDAAALHGTAIRESQTVKISFCIDEIVALSAGGPG